MSKGTLLAGAAMVLFIPIALIMAISGGGTDQLLAAAALDQVCGSIIEGAALDDGTTYSAEMAANARAIFDGGTAAGAGPEGQIIALAVALVETRLGEQDPAQGSGLFGRSDETIAAFFYVLAAIEWEDLAEGAQGVQSATSPEPYRQQLTNASRIWMGLAGPDAMAECTSAVLGGSTTLADSPNGPIALVTVGGITVAAEIGPQVAALLAHAARDGLTLTGGGYRDSAQQIRLRIQNCAGGDTTNHFAIYLMSPNSCRPPTARPGQSLHERGLAIDFNSCSTKNTACHQWLAVHAATYGLHNLPSEPWHWSTTGG